MIHMQQDNYKYTKWKWVITNQNIGLHIFISLWQPATLVLNTIQSHYTLRNANLIMMYLCNTSVYTCVRTCTVSICVWYMYTVHACKIHMHISVSVSTVYVCYFCVCVCVCVYMLGGEGVEACKNNTKHSQLLKQWPVCCPAH